MPVDGFDPNANQIVNAVALQPDGKILVGGYFTQLNPNEISQGGYGSFSQVDTATSLYGHLARLNHDGTVDSTFVPGTDDVVRVITLQPNGDVIVGGQFQNVVASAGGSAVSRKFTARFKADGSIDSVFNPNPDGVVYAIAYQANGQIIIGGSFTHVTPGGTGTTFARNHIARFNSDGTLDTAFDPNADKPILAISVEPNGQILVGGGFSTLTPNGSATSTNRSCAARLNSDGTLDTTFDPEPNGSVMSFQVLANGQIIMAGEFLQVEPNGSGSPTQANFLARLNSNGTIDSTFIINPNASVVSTALQQDGKLLIAGNFIQVQPVNGITFTSAPYVARINQDGSVDSTFLPTPNQAVNAVAVQPDGNVVLGGYFSALSPVASPYSVNRNFIARVGPYGQPDQALDPDAQGQVLATAPGPNGQTYVAGTFETIGGASQGYLARVNADGSLDPAFAPTVDGPVQALLAESNGNLLIGGSFGEVDGFPRSHMARLKPDGTIDGAFNPNPNGSVSAIVAQGTQLIVCGNFSQFQPNGSTTAYALSNMARINDSDGSLDLTFYPNPNGAVYALAFQTDGRILVAGGFTSINNSQRNYLARLLPTGAIDTAPFNPEANSPVFSIAVQPDGNILVAGGFTTLQPQTGKTSSTFTTTTLANGNVVTLPQPGYSAPLPIPISYLARLKTDGEVDPTFAPDPSAGVIAISLLSNGQIVTVGAFTSFAQNGAVTGTIRNYIGLVNADGSLDANFNPNANGIVECVSQLSNGNLLIGGLFTTLQPPGAAQATQADHLAVLTSSGSPSSSFVMGSGSTVTGSVAALAQQPNGQLIVGGSFSRFGGNSGSYLSRFNSDGTADVVYAPYPDGPVNAVTVLPSGSLTPTPTNAGVWLQMNGTIRHTLNQTSNGEITCIAQQANGQVIVGGSFYAVSGSTTLQNIMRLNLDGTIDTTFAPVPNGLVTSILIDPAGRIYIGGAFNGIGGNTTSFLARLDSSGNVDKTFLPQPSAEVLCMQFDAAGNLIVGGDFTYATPTATTLAGENSAGTVIPAESCFYIARFMTDGTLDTTFAPYPNGPVYTLAVLPSKQIVIGGSFSTFNPNKTANTLYILDLARLNSDGTVDQTFYPDSNAAISTLAVLPDGSYLVGGAFTAFEPNPNVTGTLPTQTGYLLLGALTNRSHLAVVNADGTIAPFDPNPNAGVVSVALYNNPTTSTVQLLVGGGFTSLQPNETGTVYYRENLVRLNLDGTLDDTFEPIVNGTIDAVAGLAGGDVFAGGFFTTVQVGGAVMVGGSFQNLGGQTARNIGRLNTDGTVDTTFTTTTDGAVNALVSTQDGRTYVGGAFGKVNGAAQPGVVLLGVDGSVATRQVSPTVTVSAFNPAPNGPVDTIAVQANGRVILGGAFTAASGSPAAYIGRFNTDGTLDGSFSAVLNGPVTAAVIQPDGKILIGGGFTTVSGSPQGYLARLNADGSLDTGFTAGANGPVQAISLQVDGSIYAGGAFTTIGGHAIPYLAHLSGAGAVDTTFNPAPGGAVNTLLVQNDGKVIAGGGFSTMGGLHRAKLARFAARSPATESFSVTGNQSTLTWTLGGSTPVFSGVRMEESTDGINWTTVGYASTTDGATWQLTGVPATGTNLFLVRASGVSLSTQYGSTGLEQFTYYVNTSGLPVVDSEAFTSGSTGDPFFFTVISTVTGATFSASGLPPGLKINTFTGVISGTPTALGTYNVVLTASDSTGSTESSLEITIGAPTSATSTYTPEATSSANRLVNLSTRAFLAGSQNVISGFVVSGTGTKPVLVRAVGPSLASFGLTDLVPAPQVNVYGPSGSLLSTNTGWSSSLASTFAQVGAFPLTSSGDAAFLMNVSAGAYTLHSYDPAAKGGILLAEIYDASATPLADPARLVNLSSRGTVSPGAGALTVGFVVSGSTTKSLLIRGVGPGLAQFGVTDALADPVLSVFSGSDVVAQNSGWTDQSVSGPDQPAITAADIVAMDQLTGAFALSAQNPDTAVIVNLPPGAYTFEVTSASNATGEVIAEVYELP
jgi:uncharacterized delta-60 repeat protein